MTSLMAQGNIRQDPCLDTVIAQCIDKEQISEVVDEGLNISHCTVSGMIVIFFQPRGDQQITQPHLRTLQEDCELRIQAGKLKGLRWFSKDQLFAMLNGQVNRGLQA